MDELELLVSGDVDAIAKCADHLAGCDACRDARHDAERAAAAVRGAGGDYVAQPDALMARVMAALDTVTMPAAVAPVAAAATSSATSPSTTPLPSRSATKPTSPATAGSRRRVWLGAAVGSALAAGVIGVVAMSTTGSSGGGGSAATGTIGKLSTIDRAAAGAGGVDVKVGDAWQPLAVNAAIPAGAELRTDDKTRIAVDLEDGTRIVADHATTIAFDPAEARHVRLEAGRVVADVAHVDNRPASFATPTATVDVVGTRFALTAADQLTSVQVVRGAVVLHDAKQKEDVRAGEEGVIDHGAMSVAAEPTVAGETAWAELEQPQATGSDDAAAGLGSLRAYKPGEARDRDWNLALAKHDVKVRIVGPIARTEITETFRNDSDSTLEGRYQFPLPPDAQIDALALDNKDAPGGFIEGAFVDKQRGSRIFQGVVDKAAPHPAQIARPEIIWVPGRWRDPALLEWQRGGRFELRVFPIPAKGARTIKLAYTQVVAPHGAAREYVYPLPHSHDGSTVADQMSVDVEVRGAQPGSVRAATYDLQKDPARQVDALTMTAPGFVPRGDLVIDYRAADGDAEVRAWSYAGGAAVAPDDKLAAKHGVGIDPKVVDAQRAVAADTRPTAVLALAPKLPRWRDDKPRDYAIVLDTSQSMVGERFTRARQLALAMIRDIDRRDRVTVLACDSECRVFGDLRAPSAGMSSGVAHWLDAQAPAGASDVVASVRAAQDALSKGDGDRDRWVMYVGDGFASTGFRGAGDIDRAIGASKSGARVTTIGIGADADTAVLEALARGGGGSFVRFTPGQRTELAAGEALASSFGSALRDATVELPANLVDAAPATLPTIRGGEEVLVAARLTGDVHGDVVLRGTVGGQKFEQHYPLQLAVSTAAGNGFVPRLWASLAIDDLERGGRGDDRARIVALSQGYGVMSRETSLLVLESQAMFDAYGVDRAQPGVKWTGEEDLDEKTSTGLVAYDSPAPGANNGGPAITGAASGHDRAADLADKAAKGDAAYAAAPVTTPVAAKAPLPRQQPAKKDVAAHGRGGMRTPQSPPMIAMQRVWDKLGQVSPYDGVAPQIQKAVTDFDAALAKAPDSRERHRDLVQALSYSGDLDRARQVAQRWLDRDALDPQGLAYEADLLGRDGKRELGLRTLAGLVDLQPDDVELHKRLARAYEQVGRMAQACAHRIALASLQSKDAAAAGTAVRCLRTLGRDGDAELVLRAVPDAQRSAVEKAATVAPVDARIAGELVVAGHWDGGADLDISLVTPDGTRISWMGGRPDVATTNVTSHDREELALASIKRGNYLVEVSRSELGTQPVRGTLDITLLGDKRSLPFELTSGNRTVVARASVWFESHLEQLDNFNMVPTE
nr:VIT domain-containing protein [Kofleriaceae bacterium]